MEDLPAIIHRLSLRMFSPEYQTAENLEQKRGVSDQAPIDPFASPPEYGVDSTGFPVDAPFSSDAPSETYASFSQKNLLRLAALTESQRTLSLFTPSIRDTVYRAWANSADRNDSAHGAGTPTYRPTTLSRIQSTLGSQGTLSSAASSTSEAASHATRPSLASYASAPTTYTLGSGRPRPHAGRKRKNRIVNLRNHKDDDGVSDVASVTSSGYNTESASQSGSRSTAPSVTGTDPTSAPTSKLREGELSTPPRSPKKKVGFQQHAEAAGAGAEKRPVTPIRSSRHPHVQEDLDPTPRASMVLPPREKVEEHEKRPERPEKRPSRQNLPRMQSFPDRAKPDLSRSLSDLYLSQQGSSGGILEQAWMTKMATEIARKVAEEKARSRSWASDDSVGEASEAPPAYVS